MKLCLGLPRWTCKEEICIFTGRIGKEEQLKLESADNG
jgi:hypothetical protein